MRYYTFIAVCDYFGNYRNIDKIIVYNMPLNKYNEL